jgi:hypothetical protein
MGEQRGLPVCQPRSLPDQRALLKVLIPTAQFFQWSNEIRPWPHPVIEILQHFRKRFGLGDPMPQYPQPRIPHFTERDSDPLAILVQSRFAPVQRTGADRKQLALQLREEILKLKDVGNP